MLTESTKKKLEKVCSENGDNLNAGGFLERIIHSIESNGIEQTTLIYDLDKRFVEVIKDEVENVSSSSKSKAATMSRETLKEKLDLIYDESVEILDYKCSCVLSKYTLNGTIFYNIHKIENDLLNHYIDLVDINLAKKTFGQLVKKNIPTGLNCSVYASVKVKPDMLLKAVPLVKNWHILKDTGDYLLIDLIDNDEVISELVSKDIVTAQQKEYIDAMHANALMLFCV